MKLNSHVMDIINYLNRQHWKEKENFDFGHTTLQNIDCFLLIQHSIYSNSFVMVNVTNIYKQTKRSVVSKFRIITINLKKIWNDCFLDTNSQGRKIPGTVWNKKKVSIKMTVTTNNLSATNNIYIYIWISVLLIMT